MNASAVAAAPGLFLDEIDSTNAEARRRAQAGERGPLWIAARRQTTGKGRRGRVWECGEGNLFATLLLTTDRPAGEAAQLSFVAALAVCDYVRAYVDPALVKVKWPNDVMIGDAKAAGILLESGPAASGLWVAVGIGLNLAYAPDNVERPATRVADHMPGLPPSPERALEGLDYTFAEWRDVWVRDGFSHIADAWTARAYGLGERADVRLEGETVVGVAEGLESDGSLALRLGDGSLRRITAGDVFFGAGAA